MLLCWCFNRGLVFQEEGQPLPEQGTTGVAFFAGEQNISVRESKASASNIYICDLMLLMYLRFRLICLIYLIFYYLDIHIILYYIISNYMNILHCILYSLYSFFDEF